MRNPPQKGTGREIVEATVQGAAGMVPVVGDPLAVAFAVAMGWTYNKRMAQWLEDLAAAVTELQEERDNLSFDDLADDPVFADAVINATRAAQASHSDEKLEALRNGVLNSIGPGAAEVDMQSRFFRLIEQFTSAHLTILRFLADPVAWFDERSLDRPNLMAGGRAHILELGIPEFRGRRDWYDLLAGDLQSAGLASPNLHVVMTGSGVWAPGLTPLGAQFLAFVTEPRS